MIKNNKYLILRRVIQLSILFLFVGGSHFGWNILMGNYSSALVLDSFVLSDPYAVLQMLFTGYIPAIDVLIGAVIVLLFYAILGGRIFCSWVCPLNIITDFASFTRKKLNIKPLLKTNKSSRKVRYYVMGLGLVLSTIFGIAAFEIINPISMLYRGVIFAFGFGLGAVIIVFLFDLLILDYGWCGNVCPVGAFYSITGKLRLLKVHHEKDNCTLCMKCKVVCPEIHVLEIIGKSTGKIKSSECTDCARCIDVCDDNALKFKFLK